MLKRVKNTKIGDVFCAQIDKNHKKYLQYIINDLTQLNSDVIRAFKKVYATEENPDLSEIVNGEVEFYAHCITKTGIKLGYWEKIGNTFDIGHTDHIIFKNKKNYTMTHIQNDWRIWKINEDFIEIGELKGENKKAHLGLVFQPERIMNKLKTGSYIAYSQFE